MRGVRGVADQHDIAMPPAATAQCSEADPLGVVRLDRVAVEYVAEQVPDLGDRRVVGLARREAGWREGREARGGPDLLVHLDDERAACRVVWVAVHLHDAVRSRHDVELERVEHEVSAEPDVLAPALLDVGAEGTGEFGPGRRIRAVRADDQVIIGGQRGRARSLSSEVHPHGERLAALAQDMQQPLPADRGETVAAARDHLFLVVHVDVVPARELALHGGEDLRVGVLDPAERLVGEHDAEAEGVVSRVLLPDSDLVGGSQLFGERGEVQAARAAANYRDPHARFLRSQPGPSRRLPGLCRSYVPPTETSTIQLAGRTRSRWPRALSG